jgi:hypothetical protein
MTTEKAVSELRLAPDFQLAYRESLGFFDDITTAHWQKLKDITKSKFHHASGYHPHTPNDPTYYQTNWDPDFSCLFEESIGQLNADGHKWVCDPHRLATKHDDCLVYSFGSNGNFFFEQHLHGVAPNCEIHVFDPKDYADEMNGAGLNGSNFHVWGLKASYENDKKEIKTSYSEEFDTKLQGLTFKSLPRQSRSSAMSVEGLTFSRLIVRAVSGERTRTF